MQGSIREAFARHIQVAIQANETLAEPIQKAADLIRAAVEGGKTVFVCGNGGSAADAQHFSAELTGRYRIERKPLAAIALTTDTSALTAIGNDYGFEQIFARQLEGLGKFDDVVVAISTSGSSPNIRAALASAKKNKMKTILLTGKKGMEEKNNIDVCIAVPSIETARIQEVHEIIYHAWCEYIDEK